MSSFQNPVGGPRDPLDKQFHIDPIEEDKLARNEKKKEQEEALYNEKLGIASFLLQLFKKAVDYFTESPGALKSAEQGARNALLSLKNFLEILKQEDRSQDAPFLNQLSKVWQEVLEASLPFKNNSVFRDLIKHIQHYPEHEAHTLGYYFSEYAGEQWIPFPYMELIQKIHSEHEKNPTSSALSTWTSLIDELIEILKVD